MGHAETRRVSTESSESAGIGTDARQFPLRLSPVRPGSLTVGLAFLTPAFLLYGLFVLWPLVQVAWLSLQRWNGYAPQTFIGFANFADLAADPVFRTALWHSLWWELAALGVVSAVGLGVALLLWRAPGRGAFLAVLFFPALLPPTVVAAVWTLVYSPLTGLLNTLLRQVGLGSLAAAWLGDPHLALPALFVAWAWSSMGISVLIFWAALTTIGSEYLELAIVEGAGPLWRFVHVIVPALRRTGGIVVLINAALAAQVFDLIFVTTGGGPGYATMLLPIDMYGRAFGGHSGMAAAVACIQCFVGLSLAAAAFLLLGRNHDSMTTGEDESAAVSTSSRPWLHAALLLAPVGVVLLPLVWLVIVALGGAGPGVDASSVTLDPRSWGWGNFGTVWNGGLDGAMLSSLLIAVAAGGITIALAAPSAFALSRRLIPRSLKISVLLLLTLGLFQPTPVLIVPLFALLRDLGLLDSPWGILLPEISRGLPFSILILWAFLSQLPPDVLSAAEIDGASPRQQMLRVALPLARPGLYAVAVWAFISSWNEYLLPTLVSQDGSLQTVPTVLATFVGNYDTQYALLAAGSLLALAPSLALYLLLRRRAGAGLARLERRAQ